MAERKRAIVKSYIDLDLWIRRDPNSAGFRVDAKHPDLGEASSTFQCPSSEQELETFLHEVPRVTLRDVRLRPPLRKKAQKLGESLYEAVFSGKVLPLLTLALDRVTPRCGLRLRFRLGSPQLFSWPWELLHDSKAFLALSERTTIVRYLEHLRPSREFRGSLPLRVLVVISQPADCAPLEAEEEWKDISRALEPLKGKVEVDRIDDPTLGELRGRLKDRPYHVLHFIGHGTFDPAQDGGALLLQGRDGGSRVTGEILAGVLGE